MPFPDALICRIGSRSLQSGEDRRLASCFERERNFIENIFRDWANSLPSDAFPPSRQESFKGQRTDERPRWLPRFTTDIHRQAPRSSTTR